MTKTQHQTVWAALALIEQGKDSLETLRDEIESAKTDAEEKLDTMGSRDHDGARGQKVQGKIDDLDEEFSALESAIDAIADLDHELSGLIANQGFLTP